MLNQLAIRNYAIVDNLDMDFKQGMSVITGETGAGKSIILGALGLTLGDRADKSVIRDSGGRTEICAEFDLSNNEDANKWLNEHDLINQDDPQICLLRRLVNKDGRSKAYINGTPVTLGNLAHFGDMLIDIHSQHEHQSLLRKATHLRLLDDFGVESGLLIKLRQSWRDWADNRSQIESLNNISADTTAQMKLIGYQVAELNELTPEADENKNLEQEFQLLDNADSTLATLQQALLLCRDDDNGNISQDINKVLTFLSDSVNDKRLETIRELLITASIQVDEAATEIQHFLDSVEINPERLEWVNQRLAELHRVARIHKVKPDELFQVHTKLKQQLENYQNFDLELEKLQQREIELREQYTKLAITLSQQRKIAANKLSLLINKQLSELEMADARLEINISTNEQSDPSPNGLETVEFLVSTNPGQAAKPLIKTASGGELSRISLAIQVTTAKTSKIPSLVFDEVDVGIGGGVARTVGKLLQQLARHTQILCVTHQAQVASQGHHHFFVSKETKENVTNTRIHELNDEEKVKEVARMLGGEELSDESLAHAEQMVTNS